MNLLASYPKAERPIEQDRAASPEYRMVARQFGREYFDGDRLHGYGGYRYDGRWVAIAARMRDFYGLTAGDRVLDVGCAKGFLLHDFCLAVPGIQVAGIDISRYAIEHVMPGLRPYVMLAHAAQLPFRDKSFDLVVSINTLHNLERESCIRALREIERVSRRFKYIQVDSWFSEEQRRNLERWVLTAVTYYEPEKWRALLREAGYTGDYYWTITE